MKLLTSGLVFSLGLLANGVNAETKLTVDGEEYTLTALMENCQSIEGQPEAQIACFNAITKLLETQSDEAPVETVPVPQALEALRAVAQYSDAETGLLIAGTDCAVNFTYFGNYFHLSRRNVSTIDLMSAAFDASAVQLDQFSPAGGQLPMYTTTLVDGANAAVSGGFALESDQLGFDAKSARSSLDDYANVVVSQITSNEAQTFDFMLVHPARSENSDEIVAAFETFVAACNS